MSEWIENTGEQPVDDGVLVDVRISGAEEDNPMLYVKKAEHWIWGQDSYKPAGTVTHWRLSEQIAAATIEKPSVNPKQAAGMSKIPMQLWPAVATAYGSLGLANGAKYGIGNYKGSDVILSIYLAATLRHLYAFIEGQECDPADGCPHISAILANMAIILEARAVGKLVDDRPIQGGYLKELEKLTEIANKLQEMHKGKQVYHYTIKDNPPDAIV